MRIELNIIKATVFTNRPGGMDHVVLQTDLPPAYPPNVSTEPLPLEFRATRGWGAKYVRETFGIDAEVKEYGT